MHPGSDEGLQAVPAEAQPKGWGKWLFSYLALIRPHLQHYTQFCAPPSIKDTKNFESTVEGYQGGHGWSAWLREKLRELRLLLSEKKLLWRLRSVLLIAIGRSGTSLKCVLGGWKTVVINWNMVNFDQLWKKAFSPWAGPALEQSAQRGCAGSTHRFSRHSWEKS